MRFLPHKFKPKQPPPHRITSVKLTNDSLVVELQGGQIAAIPFTLYPRLLHGTVAEREDWQLIGPGTGIHWPSLDEDISAGNILVAKSSLEGEGSFRRWLAQRAMRTESNYPESNQEPANI